MEKQKTIQKEVALEGVGLHTGNKVKISLKPAEANRGIVFIRMDLPGKPVIKSDFTSLSAAKVPRCTSIGKDETLIYTVEHLMSALFGLGVDNLSIEINGNEVPGLDGSAIDFLKEIKKVGLKELEAPAACFEIKEPILVERNGSSICAFPAKDFQVSYTLDYNHHPFLKSQFFNTIVTPQSYELDIAPCRTFCLQSEEEELRKKGLGKGANYKNTLVLGPNGVLDNKLRFEDEFVRHKILDLIGDIYLLGVPVKGHIVAVKSGHTLNCELLFKIAEQKKKYEPAQLKAFVPDYDCFMNSKTIDINGIMKMLPHRYPFLLVDRIVEIEHGKRAVGIKNVTINDNFFRGHFPSKPVMPGVLMVEGMAQVCGIALLTNPQYQGQIAFFMAADKVKFRKVVTPGDQLVMEAVILRAKSKTAQLKATAKVNGEIVAEAELLFSLVPTAYLNT